MTAPYGNPSHDHEAGKGDDRAAREHLPAPVSPEERMRILTDAAREVERTGQTAKLSRLPAGDVCAWARGELEALGESAEGGR